MKTWMLYLNDSTHAESLVEVEPYTEAEIAARNGFRPELKLFHACGEMEKLLAGSRDIDVRFDPNTLLEHRAGCGVIITDEQAAILREKTAAIRAQRQRVTAPASPSIATGELCHSCGRPRKGKGECRFCGDDTRY